MAGDATHTTSSLAFESERFELRGQLGAGGMGIVYRAYDRVRRIDVALKTLRTLDGKTLYNFKHEFRSLTDIVHPNLVTLYELRAMGNAWFFTMALVEGVSFIEFVRPHLHLVVRPALPLVPDASSDPTLTLDTRTSAKILFNAVNSVRSARRKALEEATLDLDRLRATLPQLVAGICALHRAGKLHRDIKPSNVMVDGDGQVQVCDFGLVAEVRTPAKRGDGKAAVRTSTAVMGTPAYMSPEQAENLRLTDASDWYSVGVMLFEALTGKLPSELNPGDLQGAVRPSTLPTPHELDPSVPRDLSELCVELLAIKTDTRPTGAQLEAKLGLVSQLSTVSKEHSLEGAFFVGRQTQLGELHRGFADSRKGQAVTVLVGGLSGMGKSALISKFLDELREDATILVLEGRCYQRESVPFKALDTVVDALSNHLIDLSNEELSRLLPPDYALLARLFPVLLRVSEAVQPEISVTPDAQTLRRRAFDALHELLARLARSRPMVVHIDDLQWGDTDSADFLADLIRGAERPPILFVGSFRSDEVESSSLLRTLLDTGATSLGASDVRKVSVEKLSDQESRDLALTVLDSDGQGSSELAERIARDAAGNPFFVAELARLGAAGDDVPGSSQGLDGLLAARIHELSQEARALLTTAAVAAKPIALALLSQAAGVRDEPAALAQLHAERFVRTKNVAGKESLEPYHDRIRETVVTRLSAPDALHYHRRLARAFEAAEVPNPQALVEHWLGAGDEAKACGHAVIGADRAAAALAFDAAADLYTTALELGEFSDDETRELRLRLGNALVAAGRGPEAADVLLEVARGADPETRLQCRRRAGEQLLSSGHLERGLAAMRSLLAEIGVKMPATPKHALVSLLWQRMKLRLRGLRWRERDESDIPAETLTRVDTYKAVSHGLGLVDNIRGADFQSRNLLAALQSGERSRVARALFHESLFVGLSGQPRGIARARALVEEGARIAEPLGSAYLAAWKLVAEGGICYFGGQFRPAIEKLAASEEGFSAYGGAAWEVSSVRLFRMWSLHRIGAFAEMAPLLNRYLTDAERRGDIYAHTTLIRSCHRVALARGGADETRGELERTGWVAPEGRYHLQHWYEFDSRAEIALYEGQAETVLEESQLAGRGLKKAMVLRVCTVRVDYHWLHARLLLAVNAKGPSDPAKLKEVRRIAGQLEQEGVGYAAVMAALLRAGIAVQKGDQQDACDHLEAAIEQGTAEHMFLHVAVAEHRLGELRDGALAQSHRARAAVWMTAEGVRDPARVTDVFAPGFATS